MAKVLFSSQKEIQKVPMSRENNMKLLKSKLLRQRNKEGDVVVRPTRHLLTVFAFMGEDHKTKSKFDLMYIGILLLLCGKAAV